MQHEDGAVCPMHASPARAADDRAPGPRLECPLLDDVFLALLGPSGVLTTRWVFAFEPIPQSPPSMPSATFASVTEIPSSPPPRA